MNRITQLFKDKKDAKKKSLIIFLTAGDPNLETTAKLIPAIAEAGADLIEIGVPFSDPIADGPTIQKAGQRALAGGTTVKKILKMVADVRKVSQVPLLLFGAYNPFLKYGLEKIVKDALKAGVDGFLIPDLPMEESEEFQSIVNKNDMHLIYLIAPTSDNKRIKEIAKKSTSFLYYMALCGVTGVRNTLPPDLGTNLKRIQSQTNLPIVVGFGISKPEHVKQIAPLADGVVVGSAVVKIIEEKGNSKDIVSEVKSYVSSLAKKL